LKTKGDNAYERIKDIKVDSITVKKAGIIDFSFDNPKH
jgi:hypothetical protein